LLLASSLWGLTPNLKNRVFYT